ncbi:MAG: hypothetical protein HN793_06010 [Rhodospirillaceae bacterium]|jgi:hypothetical protein|nr:hypothetical protein [Rhodospirillaceae bacterium]MBT5566626.1 hypothetical protein [Rhodospirillaceae bacterium]MBT6090716.1 hypothetical protein [Rhodospirillaceae bacterium]MBT7450361.1 hypothetical protein [Rhodospirillaceae bacterium]
MNLATEWVRCRKWLLPALERSQRFFSEVHIVDALVAGEYELYPTQDSAVVHTIVDYPAARAFVFLLAGGDLEDLRNTETCLIEKARLQGCNRVEYCGRRGWLRELGYEEIFSVGIKDI